MGKSVDWFFVSFELLQIADMWAVSYNSSR